jgi:hypothetical protein
MTSEFLHGALGAYRETAADARGFERARGLVRELLGLVAEARERAARLEAERDVLRRELDALAAAAPAAAAIEPSLAPDAEPSPAAPARAGRGDMRRSLEPLLGEPGRRRRAGLVALLGGRAGPADGSA